ncbi:unnamed protein product [Allacma fusca]|uniref:Protein kinase domain-containing protein n=1 Tax=Allacma fusca TaxID=39272 RepID=A0A8J2JB89_9HEXA|nr:unnamed protein product [Allacma fusca]
MQEQMIGFGRHLKAQGTLRDMQFSLYRIRVLEIGAPSRHLGEEEKLCSNEEIRFTDVNSIRKQEGEGQVIDFGSSCYENQRVYTYIQSRFYRAPEVILGAKYGLPIDMWSLGCILAELLTGYPLLPGEDEADQLACMIELLGMPPPKLLEISRRAKNFISSKGYPRYCEAQTLADGTTILNGGRSRRGKLRGPPGSRDLQTALQGCEDPLFVDFIRRCLEWDPSVRLTPGAALRHPWLRRRLPRTPADKNDSASVPPSGSNALRTSSKTNIHNGNSGSSTGTTNGTSSGDSKSELRVSCASGISTNGNCSTLTNGHGHSGHTNGHVNGHGHSLANHHGSSSNGIIISTSNGTATLNGRHNLMRNSEEGNNNGSTVTLNGTVNGIITNGHGGHSLTNGQSPFPPKPVKSPQSDSTQIEDCGPIRRQKSGE